MSHPSGHLHPPTRSYLAAGAMLAGVGVLWLLMGLPSSGVPCPTLDGPVSPLEGSMLAALLTRPDGRLESLIPGATRLALQSALVFFAAYLADLWGRPLWKPTLDLLLGPSSFVSSRLELLAAELDEAPPGAQVLAVQAAATPTGPWVVVLCWLTLVGPSFSLDLLACRPLTWEELPLALLPWAFPFLCLAASRRSPVGRTLVLACHLLGSAAALRSFLVGRVFWGWARAEAPAWAGGLMALGLGLDLLLAVFWWLRRRETVMVASDQGIQPVELGRWGGVHPGKLLPWSRMSLRQVPGGLVFRLPGTSNRSGASWLLEDPGAAEWMQSARTEGWKLSPCPPEGQLERLARERTAVTWILVLSLLQGGALASLIHLEAREKAQRHPATEEALLDPSRSAPPPIPGDPRPAFRAAWSKAREGFLGEVRLAQREAARELLRTGTLQTTWVGLWERQARDLEEHLKNWEAAVQRPPKAWEPQGEARREYLQALRAFTVPMWIQQPGSMSPRLADREVLYQGHHSPEGRSHLLRALAMEPNHPVLTTLGQMLDLLPSLRQTSHPLWANATEVVAATLPLAQWSTEAAQSFWWTLQVTPPETPAQFLEEIERQGGGS